MTVYDDRCLCRGLWFWLEDESIKPVTSMEPRRMMDGVKSITKYIIKKTSDIFSASTGIPCTNMQYIRIFRKSVFCLFSLLLVPIKWRCTHPRLIVCEFGTHHTTHRATLPWHVAVKLNSEQQIWKKKMVWDNGYLVAIIASTISYLVI